MEQRPQAMAPLVGEQRVDVAVVGAGFTGLGAALALCADGYRVAVIERDLAGAGASGRNAGHLTPTIGKDLPTLQRVYGRERAGRFVRLAEAGVDHVEELIERHEIECAYHPGGNVMAAVHPSHHEKLERTAEAAASLGAHAVYLGPEDMRKRGLPPAFTGGVLEQRGGVLHPGRYLVGLRRAALAAGALLYEETPLLGIEDGPSCVLRTPRGSLRADRVVLGTNAFTPELGRLRAAVLPTVVSLFRTRPLSDEELDLLDWRGREGIYTTHELLESYRLTPDRRILGGSKYVRFGRRRVPEELGRRVHDRLARTFRDRFPDLDVPIESFWSGPIAMTLDLLPALGVSGRYRNVFHAVGYCGHGIALASYAGRALADWIAGRDGPGRALIERRSLSMGTPSLGWASAQAIRAGLRLADLRLDRRARRLLRGG